MLNISGLLNVKRYIVLICAFFAVGIFFASGGRTLLSFLPTLLLFTALFISAFILIARIESIGLKVSKIILLMLICAISFSLGALRYERYDKSHTDSLKPFLGRYAYVYGEVQTEPKISASGRSLGVVVDIYKIENTDGVYEVRDKIALYFSESDTEIHRGDSIYGITKLDLVPTYEDFNYRKYMKQKEIFYSGYSGLIHIDSEHTASFSLKNSFMNIGYNINSFITAAVDKHFSSDDELGAILKGILVGDKTDFTDEMRTEFSKAGISHIAAVSGMHVSILFTALLLLFGLTRVNKRIISIITIPLLIIFAAAASFTPSVCRAVIMLILFLISYIFRRNPDSITSLFFAGGVMLTINPNYLFSVSFLLSFSATLAILYFAEPLSKLFKPVSKLPYLGKYIQGSLSVSVSSFLGICIPVAYFFNILSLSSIIVNLWVIPLVYVIFCGGYIMCALELIFSPAAHLFKYLLEPSLALIKSTSAYFSEVPFLVFNVPAPSAQFMCLYFGLLFSFYFILTRHTVRMT